jgi:hypothetical protein
MTLLFNWAFLPPVAAFPSRDPWCFEGRGVNAKPMFPPGHHCERIRAARLAFTTWEIRATVSYRGAS